jgi:hypothetical protein
MSKKRNNSDSAGRREQERVLLNRLVALTSTAEGRDQSVLDDDLRECGIDPTELRTIAHDRLRRVANHNYATLDKETPAKLKDFLRQMQPPTPEEQRRKEQAQATSKISDLLSSIRSRIASTFGAPILRTGSLGYSFRNKKKELTQRDRDLLDSHQSKIDAESDDDNRDDH